MIALLVAGQLADWASTMWALGTGRFAEGNPLFAGGSWLELTGVKAAAVSVAVLGVSRLTGWRRRVAAIGIAALGAWAAGHNVGVII